jgi:hypothetical protein
MIGIVLSHLLPLGFIFAGLWDGRDVIVIFWIESLIIFFYAMVRLALNPDDKFFGDNFFAACLWGAILLFIWLVLGSVLSSALGIYSRDQSASFYEARALLNYSYERNGWVAVLALLVVHGIEEMKCYRRTRGYRTIPAKISVAACKQFLTLFVFTYMGSFVAVMFFKSRFLPMVVAVILVALRIAMDFWFVSPEPAADAAIQKSRKASIS